MKKYLFCGCKVLRHGLSIPVWNNWKVWNPLQLIAVKITIWLVHIAAYCRYTVSYPWMQQYYITRITNRFKQKKSGSPFMWEKQISPYGMFHEIPIKVLKITCYDQFLLWLSQVLSFWPDFSSDLTDTTQTPSLPSSRRSSIFKTLYMILEPLAAQFFVNSPLREQSYTAVQLKLLRSLWIYT